MNFKILFTFYIFTIFSDQFKSSAYTYNGFTSNKSPKIIGGRVARRGEFPYQLSLMYNNKHVCGAVIIDLKGALTAAHCVVQIQNLTSLYVVGGQYKLNEVERGEQHIRVVKIKIHPLYDSTEDEHDLAYLYLTREFIFDRFVKKIKIISDDLPLPETSMVTTSGWGLTHDGLAGSLVGISNVLQTVDLPLVTNRQCHRAYHNASILTTIPISITNTMICAGDLFKGGKDSCGGDSGGPLVQGHRSGQVKHDGRGDRFSKEYLVGITSFGIGCGRTEFPGVYTRVSKYKNWIRRVSVGGQHPQEGQGSECGGLVLVEDQSELFYENLEDNEKTCFWVIRSSTQGGPIGVKLTRLNGTNLTFQNGFSSHNSTIVSLPVTEMDMESLIVLNYTETLLVFTSKRGQRFRFELKDLSQNESGSGQVWIGTTKIVRLGKQGQGLNNELNYYSYPNSNGTQYLANHRRYIFIEPIINKIIKLNVQFVETEFNMDFVKLFQFSRVNHTFNFVKRYTGNLGSIRPKINSWSLEGKVNEPVLIYFRSDDSVQAKGLKFSYAYIDSDDEGRHKYSIIKKR